MLCHFKKIKDIYIPYSRKNLFYWFLLGLRHGTSILRFSHLVKTLQNFLISILAVHFSATIIVNGLRSSKFMVGTCQSQLSVVLSLIWRRQASPSHLTPLSQATHNRVVIVFVFLQESFFSTAGALIVITVLGVSIPSIHSPPLLRRASPFPNSILTFPKNIYIGLHV